MIIQIKMDIKRNHAIIKYFKTYIAVIILAKNLFLKVLDLPGVFNYVP